MTKDEHKVNEINLPTYGYLMDRRSSKLTTVEAVIWDMVSVIEAQEKRINELKAPIQDD